MNGQYITIKKEVKNNKTVWCCLFSQTGGEIYNLSKKLERIPDVIITNSKNIKPELVEEYGNKIVYLPSKPTIEDYIKNIPKNAFVTLHGWLRIIPAEVCEKYEIYNSHPANLVLHPNLKGKDPQERAAKELIEVSGNTIHRCTAELDAGEIQVTSEVNIAGLLPFEVVYKLHKDATNLWFTFLNKHLIYNT